MLACNPRDPGSIPGLYLSRGAFVEDGDDLGEVFPYYPIYSSFVVQRLPDRSDSVPGLAGQEQQEEQD